MLGLAKDCTGVTPCAPTVTAGHLLGDTSEIPCGVSTFPSILSRVWYVRGHTLYTYYYRDVTSH